MTDKFIISFNFPTEIIVWAWSVLQAKTVSLRLAKVRANPKVWTTAKIYTILIKLAVCLNNCLSPSISLFWSKSVTRVICNTECFAYLEWFFAFIAITIGFSSWVNLNLTPSRSASWLNEKEIHWVFELMKLPSLSLNIDGST